MLDARVRCENVEDPVGHRIDHGRELVAAAMLDSAFVDVEEPQLGAGAVAGLAHRAVRLLERNLPVGRRLTRPIGFALLFLAVYSVAGA